MDTSSISFTALYTGHVWYANQMSERFFTTPASHALYWAMQPLEATARKLAGMNVTDTLLQRHQIIDQRLDELIRHEGVTQVLEIACGLSPRGFHFVQKYPQLRYVEADLPHMVTRKRNILARHGQLGQHHDVQVCNFFEKDTTGSLENLVRREFDSTRPLVILTEGLVNYFELPVISAVWARIARLAGTFPKAWYLTDLYPDLPGRAAPFVRTAAKLLGAVSRAEVSLHFNHDEQIEDGFKACGFSPVTVHKPEDWYDRLPIPQSRSRIRVVEATVSTRSPS
jgi:O-methyltransferase involved in polyketide biosynthesis